MTRIGLLVVLLCALPMRAHAETPPDGAELTRLLREFLAGASRNDPAVHERFWAEDLIYTSSSGKRIGKADILVDLKEAPAPDPRAPVTTYTAEEIRIQQYGNTAVVAFRLIGRTEASSDAGATGSAATRQYFNTGTFVRSGETWRAVAWQATLIPDAQE